ncbi:MAG: AAC(3) family N-acetyltransferase [Lachnospiraceae bacterium]|nr:AAC(3) family N-acetyltransferase [Lachnospiraceae bacterium]
MDFFYSKEQLKTQLKDMGLKSTDAVMIHSSMKAIGHVENGADDVLDALMEYFSEGLLMMPTHTWKQMSEEYPMFDPETEQACVGLLPNMFMKRQGVYRSLHPTHSIAAYGAKAEEYVRGEENLSTPCAPEGCWGRLMQENAKILLIGVTHTRNTYIHGVEEILNVPERLTEKPVEFQVKLPDGTWKKVNMHRHYNRISDHISENYDIMLEGYFETGAAKRGSFGKAQCILCDARKIYEVTKRVASHNPNFFIECTCVPRQWYMEDK